MKKTISYSDITAVIDSREQLPYEFGLMPSVVGGLHVGDYSVAGMESIIAVERKSLSDLIGCCGRERDRFQRELDRLRGWPVSAIVVEASWTDVSRGGWRSQLTPGQVRASLTSWISQGHCIVMAGTREEAAIITRDILFYAARHRFKSVRPLLDAIEKKADEKREAKKKSRAGEAADSSPDTLPGNTSRGHYTT